MPGEYFAPLLLLSEQMSDQVLTAAVSSVPTMITVLIGILVNNARLGDFKSEMNARLGELRSDMNARFVEMRETTRADLRRVEEVIDARLKHLEER
jgi:hypothetical protein